MVRRKYIRLLADRLLAEHHVHVPPVKVSDIAKALGVEVRASPAEDGLSGFLYRDRNQNVTLIGVNADHHPHRRHFTIAHELGHFLLHDFDAVHVDRDFRIWLRSDSSIKGTETQEKEANLFAAELLMPRQFLIQDIQRIDVMDLLKEEIMLELGNKYGVSSQAMTIRLGYLGYIQH